MHEGRIRLRALREEAVGWKLCRRLTRSLLAPGQGAAKRQRPVRVSPTHVCFGAVRVGTDPSIPSIRRMCVCCREARDCRRDFCARIGWVAPLVLGTFLLGALLVGTSAWAPQQMLLISLGTLAACGVLQALLWWDCVPNPRVVCWTFALLLLVSFAAQALVRLSMKDPPCRGADSVVPSECAPREPRLVDGGPGAPGDMHIYLQNTTAMDAAARYAVCDHEWHGLNIVDLAIIASVFSYQRPGDFLLNATRKFFPGWEYAGGAANGSAPMWHEYYHAAQDVSLIAVTGTSSSADMFFDMQFFASTLCVRLFARVMPLYDLLMMLSGLSPHINGAATAGVLLPGVRLDLRRGLEAYMAPLIHYTNATARGRTKFVTGHSLGGGLAQAVGARLGLLAVTFEAPSAQGAISGLWGSGPNAAPWASWSMLNGPLNVRALDDFVAMTGKTSGLTQDVTCDGFPTMPLVSCHTTIASVLLKNCNPASTRARFNSHTVPFSPKLPDTFPNGPPPGMPQIVTPIRHV